ncbi:MAG: hypothetical protein ACOC5T_09435, partial [Elusimicrobiota bacterium]
MSKREFRDPLKDLNSTYRSKKEKEDIDWSKFHYTFNAYQIKLKHLFMIYERYKLREKSYEKYLQQCQEMINARKENRPYNPDGRKTQESKRIRKDRNLCEIDYEDFFLHARILMDYVARLTPFFFDEEIALKHYFADMPRRYKSFNNHKKWFVQKTPSGKYPLYSHI